MRFKTLLLGSATAFAFAGGSAQAADLSVAEPVDYVRVCDAFGAGYWYIPGTDTCIRIGGEVEFRFFYEEDAFHDDPEDGEPRDWRFRTQFDLDFTTKSMTDWGPLTTYINLTSDTAHDFEDSDEFEEFEDGDVLNWVEADEYYLSLGPVLLGLTQSSFDVVGGGLDWTGQDLTDNKVDQVQLSWAFNGFGLVLGLESPDERWGSNSGSDMPDLVAALTAGGSGWEAKVAVLYSQDLFTDFVDGGGLIVDDDGDLWAVEGGIEFDVWGDQILIGGLWAEGPQSIPGDFDWVTTNGWAVLAGYQHNWSSNLWSAIQLQYVQDDFYDDQWNVHFTTAYSPVDGLWVGAQVGWYDYHEVVDEKDWDLVLFAERKFGG